MKPTDDHQPAPPATKQAAADPPRGRNADAEHEDRLQMQREATALRWMLAVGLVWAAWELHRLADRIAAMFDTTP